ncbi:DUF535 family protein [Vogesella sp. LIG4]|uniref:VirK/YbjX family protein n=1 Tax=Vogesella sp. LIG4 TaxID=1192162 RepID=UPI00082014B5|nr:DUF535 family protein [Vogesella sp. LIG4]SCK15355.1 hypothetical protein PSELUDRAFT_1520 [Vogesella sp. LIG4]
MLRTLLNATALYGQGQQGIARRCKFLLRALAQWPYSEHWFRYLQAQPELVTALPQQPQWLHKLQRPYLCAGYGTRTKLRLLRQHFELFLQRLPQPLRHSLLSRHAVFMAAVSGKSGMGYRVQLSVTHTMDKEGELMLTLQPETGGQRLATLAFSFGQDRQGRAQIYIGCLQGPSGQGGRDLFREVTKDLHGLMPKVLLMKSLYALARLMGIDTVLAVSNLAHVHNTAWRRYQSIQADYDAFWHSLGSTRLNARHFRLDTAGHERPLSEVPSSKRAQYQRRRALEHTIAEQFGRFWLTGPDRAMPASDPTTPPRPCCGPGLQAA